MIRYEDLVDDPDGTLKSLCGRLELDYVPNLKEYMASEASLGDATAAQHRHPVSNYLDRWKSELDTPAKRDVAASYLEELGPDLIRRLGYDPDRLRNGLPYAVGPGSLAGGL